MAVLWFEPSVAVPRLFLTTELHSWLPFGYFSAINDRSLTSSTAAGAVFLVVKCTNPQNVRRLKKFPCLTDHHNERIMATK